MRVLSYAEFTRRDRFVLAAALSFGLGDLLVPGIFTHLFDGVENPSSGLQGLFNSITITFSTPCTSLSSSSSPLRRSSSRLTSVEAVLAAGIVASLLNIILPREMEESAPGVDEEESCEFEMEAQRHNSGSSDGKVEV